MKFSKIIVASTFLVSSVAQAVTTTPLPYDGFEDLELSPNSFWNGVANPAPLPDGTDSSFVSGTTTYSNNATDLGGGFTSWSGWSYSNMTDTTTPGFGNQYSAYTGSGYASDNYGVAFLTASNHAQVSLADSSIVQGAYFTNTTYAALSMLEGDSFAKKFGGVNGNDEDWFKLTIRGKDGNDVTGEVDFYLADYRFSDNSLDYVVDSWDWVDLTSLGAVNGLDFALSSSDNGAFGMNTPAYFALDSLAVTSVPVPAAFWLMGSALFGLAGVKRRKS